MKCSNAYNLGYKDCTSYENMSAATQLLLSWVIEADDIGIFPSESHPRFVYTYSM